MKKQTSQKKRETEVYATAAQLFARKGFHATRMQDIADELGMQKGSLYYYFNSKDELLHFNHASWNKFGSWVVTGLKSYKA